MGIGAVMAALALSAGASVVEDPAAGEGASAAGPDEMTLEAALAELDARSLLLVQARRRAEAAEAVVSQASSALVPSLSAQASYVRNSDDARVGPLPPPLPPIGIVIQPLELLSAAGQLRVPLVVPGAWWEVKAARGGARAARSSADAAAQDVRTAFAQAAFAGRSAEEMVVASEHAVASAAAHARSAERRVAAGTAAPLDALKAKTEQVRRESDLARARAELSRVRLALGVALGRDRPVRVLVPEVAEEADPDAAALTAVALERRPDMAAARAQVEAARAQVRSGWARLAPIVSATGSVFAQDVPLPTGEKNGWRATVDLVWPIFDGGLREGRRREAEAKLASARAAEEAQRLSILQEVADASRDLGVARERLRLAGTQRRLAADAAASAQRSFDAGVATSLDVLDANDRLYLADVGLAEARARLAQARVGLDRATGR